MYITRIELENWGPHKHLSRKCEGRVMGIVGGNGKGKSNLLQALAYALTGELGSAKGTDYIRNFGQPDGAESASVCVEFSKDGRNGIITRSISSKGYSRRTLTWDGKQYTKASDVDATMMRILGCDKDAVRNAVYIKQGEIDRLVRGTPSERYETFIKLLGLSGMEKRSELARKKCFQLKAGLQDFTALEERLAAEKADLEKLLTEHTVTLHENEYAAASVGWWGEVVSALTMIRQLTAQHSQAVSAYTKANSDYLTDLQLGGDRREAIREVLEAIVEAEGSAAAFSAYNKAIESQRALLKGKIEAGQALAKAEAEVAAAGDATAAKQASDTAAVRVAKIGEVIKLHNLYTDSMRTLDGLKDSESRVREAIGAESAERTRKENELAEANRKMHLAALCQVGGGECPVCGGKVSDSRLAELADTSESVSRTVTSLQAGLAAHARNMEALGNTLSSITGKQVSTQAAIDDAVRKASELVGLDISSTEVTADTLGAMLDEAGSKAAELKEAAHAAEDAAFKLQVAKANMAAYEKVDATAIPVKPEGDENAIAAELAALRAREAELRERAENHARLAERQRTLAAEMQRASEALGEWNSKLDALEESAKDIHLIRTLPVAEEQLARAREALAAYTGAKAIVDDVTRRMGALKVSAMQLEEDKERNRKLLQLVDDLQTVAGITSKNGVPLAFADTVFKSVHPVVADLLAQMQANFTVQPDKDRPLTYKFVRTDNTDGYTMQQERLSGGQAIRLAIALLVAAQRTILPDVGLLILDEPSSHVDAAGVESMRDMFAGLAGLLENADMQLFVVDHNPDLMVAFTNLIKL